MTLCYKDLIHNLKANSPKQITLDSSNSEPKNDLSVKKVPVDTSKLSGPDFIRFLFTSTPKTDIASDSENNSRSSFSRSN